MPQASSGRNLDEAKFNNLCAHYKDTYEIHLSSIKQRDTLFYALLVILALFSLQVTSTELVNSALSGFINKQLDISIDKNSNLLGTLLWLLLFGFSSRYYQTGLCCTSRKADEITPAPDAAMPWHPRAPCSGARVA